MKKHVVQCVILTLFGSVAACEAQGTLKITFDQTLGGPGMDYFVQRYSESDLLFKPSGAVGFGLVTTPSPGFPYNGSCYLQAANGDNVSFGFLSYPVFSLDSLDLAAYDSSMPNFAVDFIGYHPDGSTVTATISGTGIDFQTYHFGSDWSDLTEVAIPNSNWSLDNVVVTVPEPDACGLLVAVGLAWGFRKVKRGS